MELRSMLKRIFGSDSPSRVETTQFKLMDSYENYFTQSPKRNYDDITIRAIINCVASNCAKFKVSHIRRGRDNKVQLINDNLNRLLNIRPNEWMSAYDFIYKVISQLYSDGNVFIKVKTDSKGEVLGLYPLSYQSLELREHAGVLYLRFTFNGTVEAIPYSEIIHLRRFFNGHDILGTGNDCLREPIGILTSLRQALQNMVRNCTRIRGILKVNGIMKRSDKEKMLAEFDEKLTSKTGSQHAIVDNTADYQQLNNDLKTAEHNQMDFAQREVYQYYGLNQKIVGAEYSSTEWQSFYQNVIQPLAVQMSQEFTSKLFTPQELRYGHEIVFSTDRLQYSNLNEKINLIARCQQSGILTINEIRELLGYEPVDDGDVRQISLNYVKNTDQSIYQTGKEQQPPQQAKEEKQDEEN